MVSDIDEDEERRSVDDVTEQKDLEVAEGNENTAITPPTEQNEDTPAVPIRPAKSFDNRDAQPVVQQTMAWFLSLTPQEQSAATIFFDPAFVAVFLAMVLTLVSTTAEAATEDSTTPWGERFVSWTKFKEMYIGYQRTPKLTNRKSAAMDASDIEQVIIPTLAESKGDSASDQPGDDTALRIPKLSVTTQRDSNLSSTGTANTANELLQSTDVVYPSIIEAQKHLGMMVEQAFFGSDSVVSDAFQFNDKSEHENEESPWMQLVAAYCGDDDKVRLGDILRARFSHEIQQSFQKARGDMDLYTALRNKNLEMFRRYDDAKALHSSMGEEEKTKVLGPFLTDLSLEPKDCGVEVVIRTPLSLLLCAKVKNHDLNVTQLSDRAQEARFRLDGDIPGEEPLMQQDTLDVASKPEESPKLDEDPKPEVSTAATDAPKESKKKKKKNKKRKGKKATVAHAAPHPAPRSTKSMTDSSAEVIEPKEFALETETAKPKAKVVVSIPVISTSPIGLSAELQDTSSVDSSDGSIDLGRMRPSIGIPKKQPSPVHATRFQGRGVVAPSSIGNSSLNHSKATTEREDEDTDGQDSSNDDWATVEVKRNPRKKSSTPRQFHGHSHGDSQMMAKKQRGVRNGTPSARQKKANRKIVKDVLHSIVERISEDESLKFKPVVVQSPPRLLNSWKNGPPGAKPQQKQSPAPLSFAAALARSKPETPVSMRDIVAGTRAPSRAPNTKASVIHTTEKSTAASPIKDAKGSNFHKKPTPTKRTKTATSSADQNTAPTYQETISAMSNASAAPNESKASPPFGAIDRKSDSSTGYTEEAPQTSARASTEKEPRVDETPPLPTLLSPENASSATSSVASSLEMPHTRHVHHHRSVSASDVNDVGYHLLDVCDRLSRDTSLFMSRRALALNIRRRERGALLSALQDSVSDLWPNQCHVQLYGSCATQLDLPASDIDVVVVGFESQEAVENPPPQDQPHLCHSKSASSESIGISHSSEDMSLDESQQVNSPLPSQVNSDRVLRLAADLESKPWAVQVRAIPRASVPVIKILADPSRLGQSSGSGEWMSRHQHLAAQAAAASGQAPPTPTEPREGQEEGSEPESYRQSSLLPWRGSDVMKGLLSLDITFEGIEHGGVGSTDFSAAVVSQFASDYGLHPDATPFVQVLMVLKELLAQRKLNEPYSGGLSSYALLLLLLALVREREVIRAEIERFEQQKVAMTSDELNTPKSNTGDYHFASATQPAEQKGMNAWKNPNTPEFHLPKPNNSTANSSRNQSPSSWASIAKKIEHQSIQPTVPSQDSAQPTNLSSKLSFAQAAKLPQPPPTPHTTTQQDHTLEDQGQDDCGTGEPSSVTPPCFPQGYNDIVEVLCTGETTAGKLLMHFLLYYGQHFDAQSAAIDLRFDYPNHSTPYSYFSPYIQRRTAGTIDPVTGMLTVDPIVVYDPLYRYDRNVARRCFAWSQVRWIFSQSYLTLASAVERSKTPPSSPTASPSPTLPRDKDSSPNLYRLDDSLDTNDPSSSLLRCLLSF